MVCVYIVYLRSLFGSLAWFTCAFVTCYVVYFVPYLLVLVCLLGDCCLFACDLVAGVVCFG